MRALRALPILLLAVGVVSAPAGAQEIPDNIPDLPGESPADRARERLEERYRPITSRFFLGAAVDVAPFSTGGVAYQSNLNIGMGFPGGDALMLAFSGRELPVQYGTDVPDPGQSSEWYVGVGYEMSGERLLGSSPLGRRAALGLGVGVLNGEASALAMEISPTYHVLAGSSWSVPVGVRLSMALVGTGGTETLTRMFLGFNLGVRWYWAQREKLESK